MLCNPLIFFLVSLGTMHCNFVHVSFSICTSHFVSRIGRRPYITINIHSFKSSQGLWWSFIVDSLHHWAGVRTRIMKAVHLGQPTPSTCIYVCLTGEHSTTEPPMLNTTCYTFIYPYLRLTEATVSSSILSQYVFIRHPLEYTLLALKEKYFCFGWVLLIVNHAWRSHTIPMARIHNTCLNCFSPLSKTCVVQVSHYSLKSVKHVLWIRANVSLSHQP